MYRKSIAGMSRIVAALLVLVVTSNGCGKTKTTSSDSGAVPDTVPGTGTLTARQDGYPTDGKNADWLEYVTRRLDFNVAFGDLDSTAIVVYACQASDGCGPSRTVRFLVIPEKHAFNVNWNDALEVSSNKRGYVTAAYWNLDRIAVPSLKLPANASLYQWVGATSETETGIQLFSVTATTPVAVAASGTPADLTFCSDPAARSKSAAKLKPAHSCPEAGSAQKKNSAMMMMSQRLFPEDLWLSCAGGCCQSSLTQVQF